VLIVIVYQRNARLVARQQNAQTVLKIYVVAGKIIEYKNKAIWIVSLFSIVGLMMQEHQVQQDF
jgi:hypothetical protein